MRTTTHDHVCRAATAGLLAVALAYVGCSVDEHYETLSFFFDGVPEPGSADAGMTDPSRPGSFGPGVTTIVSGHSAYMERRCAECHGESARYGFQTSGFSGVDESICSTCHETDVSRYSHGPVAAGACLTCHEAHVSTYPILLIAPAPALCIDCHTPGEGQVDGPDHADLERDCLDCHFAHGGDDPLFIRPSYRSITEDVAGDE